jgi:hypothetical protein
MSLILTTNPVGSAASKFFAGFQKCEFVFKREDLSVTSIDSGTDAKARINHAGDLTSYLDPGDTIGANDFFAFETAITAENSPSVIIGVG